MRPSVSVLMATYNRKHLLRRSIETYNNSNFDLNKLQVVVVDDGSTDGTEDLMKDFDTKIDVVYVRLRKTPSLWRDVASVINYGMRTCSGDVIFSTHPEVMVGRNSLQFAADTAVDDKTYAACRIYYLDQESQEKIDTVDWRKEGLLAAREIEGFYAPREGQADYHPTATDGIAKPGGIHQVWESWVASAMSRSLWSKFGGFIPTTAWGSCDLIYLNRRRQLGIRNVTSPDDETICIHQNHDSAVGDFVPTDRDMQKCFSQATRLTREQCCYPAVNELWGPI